MDYPVNLKELSPEELQDEYSKLFKCYLQLCKSREDDAQRIHDLKRSLDTAIAAENYLANELEQLAASERNAENIMQSKIESKLEELRIKNNELSGENISIQQDCESMRNENAQLRKRLGEAASTPYLATAESITDYLRKRQQELEQENLEMIEKLEEIQESVVNYTMTIAENERIIEVLQDQVKCTQENMSSKCKEMEELTLLLESTQDQLLDANAKIAMLTATPDNNNHKGNSLFAEVDDQRQAMKQLLAAQKSSYLQMKKAFMESEYEIRRLKRENIAIHTELKACSSIFCNADKTYQRKLIERIRQLLNEKSDLEKKLSWTQDLVKEVASDKGVVWIDSMLKFCKQETAELKRDLHSVRIEKAGLEEQLRNVEQEMSRRRFESLKSKCAPPDKENIPIDNEIDPTFINEVCFIRRPLQSAQTQNSSRTEVSSKDFLSTKKIGKDVNMELLTNDCKTLSTELEAETLIFKDLTMKEEVSDLSKNIIKTEHKNVTTLETPTSNTYLKDISELTVQNDVYRTKSILLKKPNHFYNETTKSVKFSVNEKKNHTSSDRTAIDNQLSKKSNVIIRKVVVKSKSGPQVL